MNKKPIYSQVNLIARIKLVNLIICLYVDRYYIYQLHPCQQHQWIHFKHWWLKDQSSINLVAESLTWTCSCDSALTMAIPNQPITPTNVTENAINDRISVHSVRDNIACYKLCYNIFIFALVFQIHHQLYREQCMNTRIVSTNKFNGLKRCCIQVTPQLLR